MTHPLDYVPTAADKIEESIKALEAFVLLGDLPTGGWGSSIENVNLIHQSIVRLKEALTELRLNDGTDDVQT